MTKIIKYLKRVKASLLGWFVAFLSLYLEYEFNSVHKGIATTSLNCLSILFAFNMVVVTHFYSNESLNLLLKKANKFNKFKSKYRILIKRLVVALVVVFTLSLFEDIEYCLFGLVKLNTISDFVVIFLTVYNLVKSYDVVQEFFNVYGTTYSKTVQNMKDNTE